MEIPNAEKEIFEVSSLGPERPPGPEVEVAPHQNEVEEGPSQNMYISRLRPRRSRPDWSKEENEEDVEQMKKAPVEKIERKLEENPSVKKRRKIEPSGSLECQICRSACCTIRELVLHSKLQHFGATFNCPFQGCHYSNRDIIQLRTHQYELDHFLVGNAKPAEVGESKPGESLQPDQKDIVGFRCPSCPYEARLVQFNSEMIPAMEELFCHEENIHGTTMDQLNFDIIY